MNKVGNVGTLYIPIYDTKGNRLHTASVRSDWQKSDWEALARMFPNSHIQSRWSVIDLVNIPKRPYLMNWYNLGRFASR